MSPRTRALFVLCVSSMAACVEADQAVIYDPSDAGAADVARPLDRPDGSLSPDGASLDGPLSPDGSLSPDGTSPDGTASPDGSLSPDGALTDGATVDRPAVPCATREVCDNGLDDNCNGAADEGCVCVPGATQRCYTGPSGAAGQGACSYGMARCEGTSEFGAWGPCMGAVTPSPELCDDVDNDCDGLVDEGFCRVDGACVSDGDANPANACQVCAAASNVGASRAWSPRPAGTVCRPSVSVCDRAETCAGSVCPADAFAPTGTLCRVNAGACDRAESCTGTSATCPDDARFPAGAVCRAATGVCDDAEACDGAGVDCPPDALAPAGRVCRTSSSVAACDPPEVCTGRDAACPANVVTRAPTSEVCGNTVDDDCDGMADEGCTPCIAGMIGSSAWQMHRLMGPVCFGRTFTQHGEPGEYAYASIPGEGDGGWRSVASATIDFSETSALCGRACSCLDGGEFTYFQTFFEVTAGYVVSTLSVTMAAVDDGARITVFNSAYPGGIVDAGSYILLGGTAVSTNLARYIVTGRNRIVITHLDDCCTSRSITGVNVVVNGAPLRTCP